MIGSLLLPVVAVPLTPCICQSEVEYDMQRNRWATHATFAAKDF